MSLDIDAVMLAWALAMSSIAAWYDLRTGLIPNRLVIATLTVGVGLGLALAFAQGADHLLAAALSPLFGAVVCSLIPLALYASKGLGGGDLKLLVALGACLGPALGFEVQVYAFAAASLYAFGRAAYEGTLFRTLVDSAALLAQPLIPRNHRKAPAETTMRELRFAPAIFVAALMVIVAREVAP